MKIKLIGIAVLFLFLSVVSYAQQDARIPIVNGKVVFSKTIPVLGNPETYNERLTEWLKDVLLKDKGTIVSTDTSNKLIVCQATDLLEIYKKDFHMFGIYMRYFIVINYSEENKYTVEIRNISYIEMDDIKKRPSEMPVLAGEKILIDRAYTTTFVRDSAEKITDATVDLVDEIMDDISIELKYFERTMFAE